MLYVVKSLIRVVRSDMCLACAGHDEDDKIDVIPLGYTA
jgi:hypothetical protein